MAASLFNSVYLPTLPRRYLKLLQDGAREWQLDSSYTDWLDSLPSVPSRSRGPDYYTSPSGAPVKVLPYFAVERTDSHLLSSAKLSQLP